SASFRKQIRHRPNLRMKARGRPQRWQRLCCCTLNLGVSLDLTIIETLATYAPHPFVRRSLTRGQSVRNLLAVAERHPHELEHPSRLLVVARRGGDRHLQPA